MGSILIIDDDAQLRTSFERLLTSEGHSVKSAVTGEAGIRMVKESLPDLVIVDVRLPGMNGLEVFKAVHELEPKLPVIIMTAYGTTELAIEATKLGAFDYVLKPFDIPEMLNLIQKALDTARFMRRRVDIASDDENESGIAMLGKSRPMQEVYKAIGKVAPTDATVLIRGESGTGKELVAMAVYQHSMRADKAFTVINCVAIPDTLLESELFGYEKGAFTGANARKLGKIEQAHEGTVFLDEIGEMPVGIQAKILRLLQERTLERLGGNLPVSVNVRVIAATNRDLEDAINRGIFREDLYYRLNVVSLYLPPLRERPEDIPLLANHFLRRYAKEMEISCPELTSNAEAFLVSHNWPGNVRELSNAMQKVLIFNRGGPINSEEIRQALGDASFPPELSSSGEDETVKEWVRRVLTSGADRALYVDMVDRFAALVITEALNLTGGNRSHAAKLLGLSRPTLLSKMDKYGITTQTSAARR